MLSSAYAEEAPTEEVARARLCPLLQHPSSLVTGGSNLRYSALLKLGWGAAAVAQSARSALLLSRRGRGFAKRFLTDAERETLAAFEESEVVLVKGGGFLHADRRIIDDYKFYYYLYHVLLARFLGKPVAVMPNSFGPFKTQFQRRLLANILRKVDLVAARESVSQAALEAIGVESLLLPDLGFFLVGERSGRVEALESRILRRAGVVGITVRPYRFPEASDPVSAYRAYMEEMAAFVRWLAKEGFTPVLIEHVLSEKEHESDRAAIREVVRLANEERAVVLETDGLSPSEVKELYGGCDVLVGTRFHSVIFALTQGIPALAIGYGGNKAQGIMEDIGLGEYVVPIGEFTSERAQELFQRILRDSRYDEVLHGLRQRTRKGRADLVATLKSSTGRANSL